MTPIRSITFEMPDSTAASGYYSAAFDTVAGRAQPTKST